MDVTQPGGYQPTEHQPAEHLRPAPILGYIDPEVAACEAARLTVRGTGNEPKTAGEYRTGEVNPAEYEAAQKAVHGLALDLEKAPGTLPCVKRLLMPVSLWPGVRPRLNLRH